MQFNWLRAQKDQPVPNLRPGASGYFSKPEQTLDPHLFNGQTLLPNVRNIITGHLTAFLTRDLKLVRPEHWLYVWLAGSGVSYQWSGDRGNGDLDVLLGLDRNAFNKDNPEYAGLGESDLAEFIDAALRERLWPAMAATNINGKTYEVTYFYNAGTHRDIRNIHPYAAYDVTHNEWTVDPPTETAGEHEFPEEWAEHTQDDRSYAQSLVDRYGRAYDTMQSSAPNSASALNAGSQLNVATAEARALLDTIHGGRRTGFQGGGGGYLSKENYRWQVAKGNGTITALSQIVGVRKKAEEQENEDLYGSQILSPEELRIRAMLYRSKG